MWECPVSPISKTCGSKQFEQGESSTLSVSLSVGFHNLSYFHREFRKKYGMTPKKFMENVPID